VDLAVINHLVIQQSKVCVGLNFFIPASTSVSTVSAAVKLSSRPFASLISEASLVLVVIASIESIVLLLALLVSFAHKIVVLAPWYLELLACPNA